jgi:hypothetical protein
VVLRACSIARHGCSGACWYFLGVSEQFVAAWEPLADVALQRCQIQ